MKGAHRRLFYFKIVRRFPRLLKTSALGVVARVWHGFGLDADMFNPKYGGQQHEKSITHYRLALHLRAHLRIARGVRATHSNV